MLKKDGSTYFKPKKDGSGGGTRANKGRGGCAPSKQKKTGRGSNRS